ncbi:tRNA-specific adenosine deaminase [Aspergillus undulatus]|uniref:tRNA-specific adenosine deaminase n=1 Tax=Aspergillus undulatus TaxID=1810928 RepID=UPI003CCD8D0A
MGTSGPDTNTESLPSRIAALVHAHFDGLPKRSKPIIRDDGTAEWIPMTGIVLVKGEDTPSETLTCVAVTTGAKCLPASQIPNCKGLVLHDCHAEVLAMRAFNFWLLTECPAFFEREKESSSDASQDGGEDSNEPVSSPSPYIQRRQRLDKSADSITPPLEIQPDVSIYMYCTCAPCGDASMELLMAEQDDPTPWAIPDEPAIAEQQTLLSGRGHFSKLGIVRRKPARADAESTKSKSCSDKIALRQVSSLLNHETSLFVAATENAYIKGLVMPEEEISAVGVERCFGVEGRMKGLHGRRCTSSSNPGSDEKTRDRYRYEFRPIKVLSIPNTQLASLWPYRKPKASDPVPNSGENSTPSIATQLKKAKPGTISAIWVRAPTVDLQNENASSTVPTDNGSKNLPTLRGSKTGLFESLINGVKQGHRASAPGLRGASALSRARMHEKGRIRPGSEYSSAFTNVVKARSNSIQAAREVLGDWVPNEGDEDWGWDLGGGLVDAHGNERRRK